MTPGRDDEQLQQAEQLSLFDVPARNTPLGPPRRLSPQQRLTLRQRDLVDAGLHPLAVYGARRDPQMVLALQHVRFAAGDPPGRPETCGSCRYRTVLRWHDRAYAKCRWPVEDDEQAAYRRDTPRMTHSAQSDVRSWWPACQDYLPDLQAIAAGAGARH